MLRFRIVVLLLIMPSVAFANDAPIRVAVFQGKGVGPSCKKLITTLQSAKDPKFQVTCITADEIRGGKLSDVDVLVFPGGSGGGQGRALGEKGRVVVRKFVREGGGYLGVCAGAYLATNDYSWSLNLMDAKVVDRLHWARGEGTVKLRLSPKGSEFFRCKGREMTIHYAQGPLLSRRGWDNPAVPDYESLDVFATEIAKNGAPRGVMARTSAIGRALAHNLVDRLLPLPNRALSLDLPRLLIDNAPPEQRTARHQYPWAFHAVAVEHRQEECLLPVLVPKFPKCCRVAHFLPSRGLGRA